MTTKRIVVVGGHHTPALAVIKSLQGRTSMPLSFFWIGHRVSMWSDRNVSAEYRDITALGIPFFDLKAGKFHNTFNPLKLARIPLGFWQAFVYLSKIKPNLVISFGGYLAVPVVIVSWLLRIPSVTHEQTAVAGNASLVIAHFAKKIFISFKSSERFFPRDKVSLVGNPLREEIFCDSGLFPFENGKRTIYITGGKQGSHILNTFAEEHLTDLVSSYNVIHQCGSSSVHADYQRLRDRAALLPTELKKGYIVKDFFGSGEIGSVFARAEIVISRAGANTIYEIGVLGKPSIIIPIPWSSRSEQKINAQFLSSGGGALVLEQEDIPEGFFLDLNKISSSYELYKQRAESFSRSFMRGSSGLMAQEIIRLLELKS